MITGQTRVFGIVADPVAHVRTPQLMNNLFAEKGIDAVMVPMHVAREGLASVLSAAREFRNLGGFIVTVPHKAAVVDLCDEVGEEARLVHAANAIRREADGRLACDMFDGRGFLGGLLAQGVDPKSMRVLLLGAGGAASAIAFALADHGVAALTIANRTREKARALADRVTTVAPACAVAEGPADPMSHDLVVNATSLGLHEGDPLPLDVGLLRPENVIAEIIMQPERTAFVQAATEAGCRVHLGRHMLKAQFRLLAAFLGVTAAQQTTSKQNASGRMS